MFFLGGGYSGIQGLPVRLGLMKIAGLHTSCVNYHTQHRSTMVTCNENYNYSNSKNI